MQLVDEYLAKLGHLPPAPTIANELLGLFSEPDCDLDRIVQLISHDPSLTAEVLKRCNSAALGGAEAIGDMFSAITRLGFYEVYCIVTAMVASRSLSIAPKNSGLDVGKLWEHSVTTAVAASALARRSGELEALAFTSGLLHDIGKLVLAAVEPARYPQLLQTHGLGGPDLLTAEIDLFKVSHAMIGAELLSRWKLPSSVIIPVLKHHDKASDIHSLRGLWASVRLGNSIAHSLKNDTVDHPDRPTEILETLDILEINANDLPAVISDISENLEKVKGLLV